MPVIAGDGIFDDFAARAGGPELGRRGQVADYRDLGEIAACRGAEGSREARGGSDRAAGEEGHPSLLWWWVSGLRRRIEGIANFEVDSSRIIGL